MLDVSIIIPVYCTTKESLDWLAECLESACSQDCEVVCYDDKSTESGVEDIIKRYPVKYIRGADNKGVSYSRNRAVIHAQRSLVLPLDSDDTIVAQGVRKLYSAWNGTPVYPDIAKFGLETEPHYALFDFNCENLTRYVGFTSVNVLHSKEQWKAIGGWNETIDFFEDGEYNARLLGTYCGVRYPEPIINYRMHANQRTKQYASRSMDYATKILSFLRSYDMPCPSCGKRRSASNDANAGSRKMMQKAEPTRTSAPVAIQIADNKSLNLPSEFEGKILTQYTGGKGAAKHYYRGPSTKFPYHVTYGDYVYADPKDVSDSVGHGSFLIRVQPAVPAPKVAEEVVDNTVKRAGRKVSAREAVK